MDLIYQQLEPYRNRKSLERLISQNNLEPIISLPEIEIVDGYGSISLNINYDCLRFVSDYLKDPSLLEGDKKDLAMSQVLFFERRGYNNTSTSEDNDIVIYGYPIEIALESETEPVEHIGVVKDKKVISMWGNTFVYKHDLNAVPLAYGNIAAFFRKIKK
ncbi:hypothetical protein HYU23_03810 [Candidatus Woesearchaeota archaeon]|nr:hypothetical protein [Candidatus Woesearchaeota archaeon]